MSETKNAKPVSAPISYLLMGERLIVHLPCERTNNRLSMIEGVLPPGTDCGLHVHQREDEALYLIDGELEVTFGSLEFLMRPGECYFVPRNVPHRLRNRGTTTVRTLQINTPGDFGKFIREVGIPLEEGQIPENLSVDRGQLREMHLFEERFGMCMLVPPLQEGGAVYDAKPPIYKRPVYNPLPDSYSFFGVQMTLHLSGIETGNEFSLAESFMPAGCDSGLHVHANEDETIYLLSGELELTLGDSSLILKAGSGYFVPRNTPHRLRNKRAADVKVIQVNTPGTLDPFIKGAGTRLTSMGQQLAYPSPEQIGPIFQFAEEYDFHMLIPPGV